MRLVYDEVRKDLPNDQLFRLFVQAGWTDENCPDFLKECFNRPFLGSTLVVSAWDETRLVGAVRVLSDGAVRSVVYDLVVAEEYRGRGIGRELLRRCRSHFPDSEWLIQTTRERKSFYEAIGFSELCSEVFLRLPSKWF